jgi:hypothetical protein
MEAGRSVAGSPADGVAPRDVKNQFAPAREGSVLSTVPAVHIPSGLLHSSFVIWSRIVASKFLQVWADAATVTEVKMPRVRAESRIILIAVPLSVRELLATLVAFLRQFGELEN